MKKQAAAAFLALLLIALIPLGCAKKEKPENPLFVDGLLWVADSSLDKPYLLVNEKGEVVFQGGDITPTLIDPANGTAAVCAEKDGKWGIVDSSGKCIIPFEYTRTYPFSDNGLACVIDGRTYLYLNRKGETVIRLGSGEAGGSYLENGLAFVYKDRWYGVIDSKGEAVLPCEYDDVRIYPNVGLIRAVKGDTQFFFDNNGKKVFELSDEVEVYGFYDDGYSVIMKDRGFGLIDSAGRTLVEPVYASLGSYEYRMLTGGLPKPTVKGTLFKNGRLAFQDASTMEWGYFDEKGNKVIPAQYSLADAFASNGIALVGLDGRCFIDKSGKVVIGDSFDLVRSFADNGLAAFKKNGKWGYIDSRGNIAIPAQFGYAYKFAKNGLAAVCDTTTHKFGFIDKTGKYVISPEFDLVYSSFFDDGYVIVKVGDKLGVIDSKGNYIIEPKYPSIAGYLL
ncbi:MAG: WG repeat-containing protein [Clostridia bacterium]|nr:WG repeat-containing protein [Clostridia bacterium]